MTNSTQQVAMGFSASAFLTPKHLPADKLFEWVDNDDLKKLKPSAEQVRDAILLCKQHGINARFTGGLALSISGDLEALHTCFGVRLMIDSDPNAKERKWFEDDTGAKQELVKPVADHPLGRHIVNIVLEPSIEPTIHQPPQPQPRPQPPPPRFPGENTPWGKQKDYHIWPHELRDRMCIKTAWDQSDNEHYYSLATGNRFCVSIVDSGLNGLHPYFNGPQGGKLTIPTFRNATEPYPMHWPEVTNLELAKTNLSRNALARWTELNNLLNLVRDLPQKLRIGTNGIGENVSYNSALQGAVFNGKRGSLNENQSRIVSEVDAIRNSVNFYQKYRMNPQTQQASIPLSNLTRGIVGSNGEYVVWRGPSFQQFNVALEQMFDLFKVYLQQRQGSLQLALRWLKEYGQRNYDYNGHGTGMAASIFGVARTAQVASFPALNDEESSDYKNDVGEHTVDLASVFNQAAEWAQLEQSQQHPPLVQVEYRIMSNSYVTPISIGVDGKLSQNSWLRLSDWRVRISDLVEFNQFSILFSAGNSRNPEWPKVSLAALLGDRGAIIVGGAYDYWDETHNRHIWLSNAAHGLKVSEPYPEGSPTPSPKPLTIPDICGFVGSEDIALQPRIRTSPYVYIPTKNDGWHYAGGGTSSACAQVAGLCGALRAMYPNILPKQIKYAIVFTGDSVTEGSSYQAVPPNQLKPDGMNNVKLANILGAFRYCAAIAELGRA